MRYSLGSVVRGMCVGYVVSIEAVHSTQFV
jgi:hypothetical protein